MGADTNIEWADHTFSPWWGCTRVSAACRNCYAEDLANRYGHNVWGAHAPRRVLGEGTWAGPAKWDRYADRNGYRARVFSGSMCDVFEDIDAPMVDSHGVVQPRSLVGERARLFDLIEATPNLDWLLLTKRPENIRRLVPSAWLTDWPINAWTGITVEDRAAAERIPHLLAVPAPIHFLSMEPLLESIDLDPVLYERVVDADTQAGATPGSTAGMLRRPGIDWVITGGESGPHARPSHPDWFRQLRDQCTAAGVAFLFKQWGEWLPAADRGYLDLPPSDRKWDRVGPEAEGGVVVRVGKKNAGRVLDGEVWNEIPASPALEVRA